MLILIVITVVAIATATTKALDDNRAGPVACSRRCDQRIVVICHTGIQCQRCGPAVAAVTAQLATAYPATNEFKAGIAGAYESVKAEHEALEEEHAVVSQLNALATAADAAASAAHSWVVIASKAARRHLRRAE